MFISILVTAAGILGLLITILAIFFQVIPSPKRNISAKTMVCAILWLASMVLGFVNLYYTLNIYNHTPDTSDEIAKTITDENTSTGTLDENTNTNAAGESDVCTIFPQEIDFLKKNEDVIQKLKTSYSKEDTEIIENDTVDLRIIEKAGVVFSELNRSGNPYILEGAFVSSAKVMILDYNSDDLIYVYESTNSTLHHLPGNHDPFYCVVIHEDYDIYVTPPIQAVGGDGKKSNTVVIHLSKKESSYTPLSQIHLLMQNSESEEPHAIPANYNIHFSCATKYGGSGSLTCIMRVPDSGILSSFNGNTYFSLNTDYVLEISLYEESDDRTKLAEQTFDGSVTNSNFAQIIFKLENENNTKAE